MSVESDHSERAPGRVFLHAELRSAIVGVALLVAREFAVLVGLATVIAWPLAYFGMREWRAGFAYSTTVSWWIFAAAGLFALLIAMATVSYHTIRAATMNPVQSLRYEETTGTYERRRL